MKIFSHDLRRASPDHAEIVRRYELARTLVEFLAALFFVVGSIFFFYPELLFSGTWLFLIGSVLFAVRPTIRLALELHLSSLPVPDEFRPYGALSQAGSASST